MSSSFQSTTARERQYAPAKPTPLAEFYADMQREDDARSLAQAGISDEGSQGRNAPGSTHFASDEEWDKARAEQRQALDQLRSTDSQKEIYGAHDWEKHFQLVESLQKILPNGAAVVTELWNKQYWNCPTNRFQRLFTNLPHYALCGSLEHVDSPGVAVDLNASHTWIDVEAKKLRFVMKSPTELTMMSCLGCLVDVDRLPPKLVQDLGLITWQRGATRGDLQVLSKLKNDEITLKLKLIFDSIEWIDGDPRVGIIREPKPEIVQFYEEKLKASRPDLLAALEIPKVALGQLLYVSEEKSGQTTKAQKSERRLLEAPLKAQVFSSAYSCNRATIHSSSSYRKERAQLADALGRIRRLRTRFEREWTKDASPETKAQLKKDLKELIKETAPQFGRATNLNKVKVRDLLSDIAQSLQDDYRLTPRAKSAQLSGAETHIQTRHREANRKNSFRARDDGAIDAKLTDWEGAFEELSKQLLAKKQHLKARPAFGGGRYTTEQRTSDKESLKRELSLPLDDFASMTARPFSSFVTKLFEGRKELVEAVDSGQRVKVDRALIKIDLVCRLQRVQARLEEIKKLTLKNSGVTLAELQQVGRKLSESVPAKPVFGVNTYRELFKEYDALRGVITKICQRLEEYASKPLSIQERDDMARRLRKHVKTFDVEAAVRAIS